MRYVCKNPPGGGGGGGGGRNPYQLIDYQLSVCSRGKLWHGYENVSVTEIVKHVAFTLRLFVNMTSWRVNSWEGQVRRREKWWNDNGL